MPPKSRRAAAKSRRPSKPGPLRERSTPGPSGTRGPNSSAIWRAPCHHGVYRAHGYSHVVLQEPHPRTSSVRPPLYPIRLCSWWLELTRGIDILRTNDKKVVTDSRQGHPRSDRHGARDRRSRGHKVRVHPPLPGGRHLQAHHRWAALAGYDCPTPPCIQSHTS